MSEYYDKHYANMKIQPIVLMQRVLSHEEFLGFLYGNVVKYHERAGNKQGESYEKDIAKRDRYLSWYYYKKNNEGPINPALYYELPIEYKNNFLRGLANVRDEIMGKQSLL